MRAGLKLIIGDRAGDPSPQGLRAVVPLDRAMLCPDCESIYEAAGPQTCPSCGSRQAIGLARVLDREVARG